MSTPTMVIDTGVYAEVGDDGGAPSDEGDGSMLVVAIISALFIPCVAALVS